MIGVLFKLVALVGVVGYLTQLIKSFNYMSLPELQRRAEAGDQKAWRVHQVRLFDPKTTLLLWFCLALSLSLVVIHIADALDFWQSLVASVVVLFGVQMLTSGSGWPPTNLTLAAQVGPAIAWLFRQFGVTELAAASGAARLLEVSVSPIHSKADHLEKLQQQLAERQDQASQAELRLAIRALTFADQTVGNVMTARRTMPTIRESIKLTPIVLDELRQSGRDYLPVTDSLRRQFVGVLYLVDLVDLGSNRQESTVKQRMRQDVYYVKGQASLMAVLRAFLKTKQYLFLVVNPAGRVIGSISIEEAIRQVITLTGEPGSVARPPRPASKTPPKKTTSGPKPKPKPKPKPDTKPDTKPEPEPDKKTDDH